MKAPRVSFSGPEMGRTLSVPETTIEANLP
jgi:hypothetical protein